MIKNKELVELLTSKNETISCMESCTGGLLCSTITDIEGSSNVFSLGIVTYSNEMKVKNNIDEKLIDKYTVYSTQVAESMAKIVTIRANATYGVGITGQLQEDKNAVYYSIYDSKKDKFISEYITLDNLPRKKNKEIIVEYIVMKLINILR